MKVPNIIKQAARNLRKDMTESEKILWENIRRGKILGKIFYKQKPIFVFTENNGFKRYIIVDFVSLTDKIVIEVDGSIHNLKEVYLLDKTKETLLNNLGFKVIRFTNNEIINDIHNVIIKIKKEFN
ncbi:MAG: endonuclease domain-containing protein [Candidatus Gracilibacteria bacterium]|nr:endonuclease domain-containing protein [Candidatus Gracilibacteria bacterium]